MAGRYKIVRIYKAGGSRVIRRGLTLAQARRHCKDPETSSRTCALPHNVRRTERVGDWYDGYDFDR